MATVILDNGRAADAVELQVKKALDEYETQFIGAKAQLYRQNSVSVRIRVIDNRFEGMTKSRRHEHVWNFLKQRLDEEILSDISFILALPSGELRTSLANLEFEDKSRSLL